MNALNRRDFLKYTGVAGSAVVFGMNGGLAMADSKSKVALVKTADRKKGVKDSIKSLGINPAKNKDVLIKPNFNTADTTPGSSHNDTLAALAEELWAMGAKTITLGERSYPPTMEVMEQKEILPVLKKLDVKVINFDDLEEKDWIKTGPKNSAWQDGFRVARPIIEAECLVASPCIKTHAFGGVFTMSLKLNVGVVPTSRHGFDYMKELHGSGRTMGRMIAEINSAFRPDLIVMDGVDIFVKGGPMTGKKVKADVFLASADRVAIDAVGLAILKSYGTTRSIMKKKIYDQPQISRAVELGLGAPSFDDIEIIATSEESRAYKDGLASEMDKG